MKFKVTSVCDIVCRGCSGTTRVAPKRVYNTDDLTCNCEEDMDEFEVTGITDIVGVDCSAFNRVTPEEVYSLDELQCEETQDDEEPENDEGNRPPADDEDTAQGIVTPEQTIKAEPNDPADENAVKEDGAAIDEKKAKPVQGEMFVEAPENVINPADDDMSEEDVRKYLKSLGWQELLEAAKNNEVIKPPKAKREELEELIIQKVFHEQVSDSN